MQEDEFADEMLSDEELNNVAGGTLDEAAKDADEFEALGVKIYESINYQSILSNTIDAFRRYGVELKPNIDNRANEYFVDGKSVSREDAWKHVKSQFQK